MPTCTLVSKADAQPALTGLSEKRRRRLPPCTVEQLRSRIGAGEYLVIIDGLVCKLNGFIDKHPGGPLAVLHMVGRDATDEVACMHPREVLADVMPRWAVARFVPDGSGRLSYVEDMELAYSAPRSAGGSTDLDYAAIQRDYRQLHARLQAEGMFACDYSDYARDAARYAGLFAAALALILCGPASAWTYVAAGLCTALLWQQLSFFAHDLGHNELTGRREIDLVLGICVADVLGGLSVGWWKKNHNTHHIVTNDVDNDPDIQHLPFFAVSTRFFESRFSTYYGRVMQFDAAARLFVSLQDKLYYVVMCFARFNLYAQSWIYLLRSDFAPYRALEAACICVFLAWFGCLLSCIPTWPLRVLYVLVANGASAILHIQITLSHFAMSTESPAPEHECFCARQVRTTMDVICPRWFDWFHGGLQFQIEHHLFPRLPRHKLQRVQPLVKDLCRRHGMEFKEFSFVDGNVYTIQWLGHVARRVKTYNCREQLRQGAVASIVKA
ncbi:hypothetical protein LPJ63_004317 [Coemansia sp. RSA 2711]|nr:hypothetical protein LPJ63_004317 [Coemansia sp. RSA 2711]KAJ2314396.1 hypothetical protein IWW54_000944 [Coemansia sp. RSA 2705]KAJ2317092.1 hypothetical protein IWW52_003308 [Coemansia sp. RSA 2704]KAJ2387060.1 hypothetical protein H4S02_003550 [Coemansia sp. RSA 2611]KAJ2731015.1 hypothetical protein H4R23_003175 [Coemansia sp. Cherry 401B]